MRVAVTGAAGFIGSHLCERLLADGHTVVGIDSFSDYYARDRKESNLAAFRDHREFTLEELDLAEAALDRALAGVKVVYHLAGRPGVRPSLDDFDSYVRENITATQRLLESVRHLALDRFVYAGSSSVYGDAEVFPTPEKALPAPLAPYGVTKLAGEHLAYLYWKNYRVPAVRLRYFSVYGPRVRPDLMSSIFMRAIADGTGVEIFGDGEQTREFTYVSDAVAGTIKAAERGAPGELYNLGGGTSVSLNRFLDLLDEITGRPLARTYVAAQPGDHRRAGASITHARLRLAWEPHVALRDGLVRQWEWFSAMYATQGGR